MGRRKIEVCPATILSLPPYADLVCRLADQANVRRALPSSRLPPTSVRFPRGPR